MPGLSEAPAPEKPQPEKPEPEPEKPEPDGPDPEEPEPDVAEPPEIDAAGGLCPAGRADPAGGTPWEPTIVDVFHEPRFGCGGLECGTSWCPYKVLVLNFLAPALPRDLP